MNPLFDEARRFIETCYRELGKDDDEISRRLDDVRHQIDRDGTYDHTFEELEHGARMAWRNSNRCIGRLFWQTLQVFDARHLHRPKAMFEALCDHLEFAQNDGKVRPAITVFAQATNGREPRIWNHQLVRYAGYETEKGVVGDPASVAFTRVCEELGWRGPRTPWDVLPVVVSNGQELAWFELPRDLVLEVPITHPECPRFADLGLRWYAVPILSDMALVIGGIRYSAAPFNGWYMVTEIGARNLADPFRYNKLPEVADALGLDRTRDATLWRDRALVELNVAVLHSYRERGVTIVDHHTAARQFAYFEQLERDAGRRVTGDWSWLIPPLSPAATHIFHSGYDNDYVTPNFVRQPSPYSAPPLKIDPSIFR
ncbi:nitric oxide synthase oxygenase [Alicyclobacillus vulcanalis]|uniref:Nitric oxide synthase oxygenase n=1 Tax=Alicyclobacillus vulcanalis TaxID=252246 RepID=A0A1N7K3V5_9BACL|nr:nitric oxide synthase oxygenase [Alicyclobacillus vulcanalis]SIS56282.1 nitric-oxide synthase [Alicyclobacillus vulcanalis]